MRIGFVGLGRMGTGMAARLLGAGHALVVFNRHADKAQPLVAQGAALAHSVADASVADVVFTMLSDDRAAEEVVLGADGVLQHLRAGAIHVSCSTISVECSRVLAEAHAQRGQGYVAAPVFGRPDAAAAGRLFLVAGGAAQHITRLQPLFDVIGQKTFVISTTPQSANLVKLSGNFLLASVIESLGEAMALVEKGGVDRHQYLELLVSSLFDVPVYRNYGAMVAEQRFEPAGFAARLGQKDLRLVLAAADELSVPLPFASVLRDRFLELAAAGGGDLDWSAIGGLASGKTALHREPTP